MTYRYQPLILIGAARSGTKLVRDLIAHHPDVSKIPYDINYIWRLGNEHLPHDELSPDMLTPQIRRRIVRYCGRHSEGNAVLIEKTVSNCLRIPFVHAVFPEAKFLHLVRDGRDVVESVYRQWLAPPDWRYIVQKALTFPLTLAFTYAMRYAWQVWIQLLTANKHRSGTWGPRYQGIDQDVGIRDVLEVCALQWKRSVETAVRDLKYIPEAQVMTLRYEEFIFNPRQCFEQIAAFVGINPHHYSTLNLQHVSSENIGKGFKNLHPEQIALVWPIIRQTLILLHYQ
ncbi:hypothetical protein GF339_04680 [candidate division KSB3 bacterium]|uniref:Sulfotransferase n=1 Tax=candidate division KSB3 bacterium TaxID=2044937 RepID=A0A9D5JTF1_9BACT|nr:hypothetical protein [candidate division KSB3 bacterium]MBD3323855.1 hypothetical protein [candidate division KSB3 bacterium]